MCNFAHNDRGRSPFWLLHHQSFRPILVPFCCAICPGTTVNTFEMTAAPRSARFTIGSKNSACTDSPAVDRSATSSIASCNSIGTAPRPVSRPDPKSHDVERPPVDRLSLRQRLPRRTGVFRRRGRRGRAAGWVADSIRAESEGQRHNPPAIRRWRVTLRQFTSRAARSSTSQCRPRFKHQHPWSLLFGEG